MPANVKPQAPFPVRGTPGGWRDPWDGPDDHERLRAEAEAAELRIEQRAAALAPGWQAEVEAEREARRREWGRGRGRRRGARIGNHSGQRPSMP